MVDRWERWQCVVFGLGCSQKWTCWREKSEYLERNSISGRLHRWVQGWLVALERIGDWLVELVVVLVCSFVVIMVQIQGNDCR